MRAIDKRLNRLHAMSQLTRFGGPRIGPMSRKQLIALRWEDYYADYKVFKNLLMLQLKLPSKTHPNISHYKRLMYQCLHEMRLTRSGR